MIETTAEVLAVLKQTGKAEQAKFLEDVMKRDIPLHGYQANLLLLNRGYGKTHISYLRAMYVAIEDIEKHGHHLLERTYDQDANNVARRQVWFKEFAIFIGLYYQEYKIDHYNSMGTRLYITKA